MKSQIFVVCACLIYVVNSEFYTAVAELEKLLKTEDAVVKSLEEYLKKEEERLEKVKWFNEQFKRLHSENKKAGENFLTNPVNAFLLVKRLTTDWNLINNLIGNMESRGIFNNLSSQIEVFPNEEDLIGVTSALIRLQEVYLLDTSTLARGEIKGTTPFTELTAEECYQLGHHAFNGLDYKYAFLWMQETFNKLEKNDSTISLSKIDILEYMASSSYALKNYTAAIAFTEQILAIEPQHTRALSNLAYFTSPNVGDEMKEVEEMARTKDEELKKSSKNYVSTSVIEAYEKLCRGESLKSPKEQSQLHCFNTDNNNSYLLLQPLKVEILNLKPEIIMFYDVIKDKEADHIKELAMPKLTRAQVFDGEGKISQASFRISKSAWVDDRLLMPKIRRRLEEATRIDASFTEELHVINYGIGGHYESHYDFAHAGDKVSFLAWGNRLATWIFYLTDVAAGGSTVFPEIGVEVKPVKGAAAFWFNLHKNGSGDYNTRHAACPVLAGSKWVANKWFHERGNEFKRPCSQSQLD